MKDENKITEDVDLVEEEKEVEVNEENKGFILCNEYGVDVEVEKVKLLPAPKDECDESEIGRRLLEQVKREEDEEKRDLNKRILIVGIILLVAYVMNFLAINSRSNMFHNNIRYESWIISEDYKSKSEIGIEYLKTLISNKTENTKTPIEMTYAYKYLEALEDSLGDRNNVYVYLCGYAECIFYSDLALTTTEYQNTIMVLDGLINEFVNSNQLNFIEASRVADLLQTSLVGSRKLERFMTLL